MVRGCGSDLIGSGLVPLAESCEHEPAESLSASQEGLCSVAFGYDS